MVERIGQPANTYYGRMIFTKNKNYQISADIKGIPIEEYMSDTKLPNRLKGAKVYETKDGPIIACQLPEDDECE